MTDISSTPAQLSSSQQELRRLILWTRDHPNDWYRVCHPESYSPTAVYLSGLVDRLCQAELYTLLYVVIFSNQFDGVMDGAIEKTMEDCFLDTPMEVLVERFRKNLEVEVREMALVSSEA